MSDAKTKKKTSRKKAGGQKKACGCGCVQEKPQSK